MENLSINTSLPSRSKAYAFGSWVSRDDGRDADILVVYDPAECDPSRAYECHSSFISALKSYIGLPIDLTLLTKSEESQVGFIEREGCVALETLLKQKGEQEDAGNQRSAGA
jgi:predicted nucleotidyltransferase